MEKCKDCGFPLNQKDVDENVYELHTTCSCEEDEALYVLSMSEQAEKTPEEIEQELKDWDDCARYIQKKGISPNLDSIY